MTNILSLPPEHVVRRPPANLDPAENVLFAHEYLKTIGAVQASFLSSVSVLPNGFISRALAPLPQSFARRPSGLRRVEVAIRALHQVSRCSSRVAMGRAFFVTDEFSNGFFHWICDALPRLEALAAAAPEELATRTLLLPAIVELPYVLPSLGAYGLRDFRVLARHERAHCEDLLVIPPVAPTGNYRPQLIQSLRERFRIHFGTSGDARRIFVSRAGAPKRRIKNEDELEPILKFHGFERVAIERLSFAEQVRLVASASILAGSHGAGLTNMIWMSPGARVLELRRSDDRANNCYYSLACALDLGYYYMQCKAENEHLDSHVANLIVDPAKLDSLLRAFD